MSKDVEIELRFPLFNPHELEAFLGKVATFRYQSSQHDMYFNAPHRNFFKDTDDISEWLRIRIADGGAQINYKNWLPHKAAIKTHCKEYETNVESYEQLSKILDALNFTKLIDVKKIRKAWNYMDTEISIDAIEGLGDFVELEYKGNLEVVDTVRAHLFTVLKNLKAKTGELDQRGYPYLLLEKQGLVAPSGR